MAQHTARGYRGSIYATAIDASIFLVISAGIYAWSRADRSPLAFELPGADVR